MATLYGKYATYKQVDVPSQKVPAQFELGKKRSLIDEYDLDTLGVILGATDVIKMMKLPAGAIVTEVKLAFPDLGTTGTCTVGWEASEDGSIAADADGFLAGVDLNTAADVFKMSDQANMPGQFKQFDKEVQVSIAMTAATTAITGKLKLEVEFILN
jgi:hypothetical protein